MSKQDLAMEAAVAREKHFVSQNKGRDASMKLSLLSELRVTSPIAFLIRRGLYKLESAMGSISNRIYALLTTVVILLVLSAGIFIAGTFLNDEEWDSLREDAGVDANSGDHDKVIFYALWLTWCFFVDPGSHTQKLDHTKYRWARLTSAFISVLGILFFSFVLGFVVDLLSSFIARVTEGSTTVVEEDHYLILGYSEKCVAVIGELATAMESDGGGVVVVLADSPTKKEFDQMVKSHMSLLGLSSKTRVVFRVGNPLITSNIAKVSPETSRAIILLSDSRMDADHADASVLHIILSLKSLIGGNNHIDRRLSSPDIGIFASMQQETDQFYEPASTVKVEASCDPSREEGEVRAFASPNPRVLSPIPQPVPRPVPPSPTPGSTSKVFASEALQIPRVKSDHDSSIDSLGGTLSVEPNEDTIKFIDKKDGLDDSEVKRGPKEFTGHVVAELQDNDNRPMIQVSGGSLVELVVIHDIIGRMLAKSVVQPNIRRIYDELLGFDGCEFYFACHPELADCTFREASLRLQGAVLVGVKREGVIMVNPDSQLPSGVAARSTSYKHSGVSRRQFVLRATDEVIVIAEDDSSYQILDRAIFDDNVCARPWPPIYPLRSALDALLTREENEAKEEAVARNKIHGTIFEESGGETKNSDEASPLPFMKKKSSSVVEAFLADRELSQEIGEGSNDGEDAGEEKRGKDSYQGDEGIYNEMSLDHSPQRLNVGSGIAHKIAASFNLSPTKTQSDVPVATVAHTQDPSEGGVPTLFNSWSKPLFGSTTNLKSPISRGMPVSPKGSSSSLVDDIDYEKTDEMAKESLQELQQLAMEHEATHAKVDAAYLEVEEQERQMREGFDNQSPISSGETPMSPQQFSTSMSLEDERGINVLLCGWRRDIKDMLRLMDKCLPRGSSVHLLCEKPTEEVQEYLEDHCREMRTEIRHSNGRADIRRRLVEYDALGFKIKSNAVDVIVVVTDEAKEKDLLMSDSQTIACCLLVRDVQADHLENRDVSLTDLSIPRLEALQVTCPMTCEVLDVATRSTIEENPSIKALAEFVVVNDLAARLIAAVADRREVAAVLGELLGPDSQDIFVVEARELLYEDEVVPNRAAACVEVGDSQVRNFRELEYLSGLAPGASLSESSTTSNLRKKKSFTHAFRRSTVFQAANQKNTRSFVRPVSFAELSKRAAAPPRRGILLGYIKASWDGMGRGELVTVFNPKSKSAPLYWHARDFLIIMSLEDQSDPKRGQTLTVVR